MTRRTVLRGGQFAAFAPYDTTRRGHPYPVVMQSDFDYQELLDSACSVLVGANANGPFAQIPDEKGRRRAAAVFMQRDTRKPMHSSWLEGLRDAMTGDMDVASQWVSWDSFNLIMRDDFEPACWRTWLHPHGIPGGTARRRRQAARNFPIPIFQAVWTAHSDAPAWRVRAAWEVLDAVDGGRKIIAPLARFLRVSRKAIKLSTRFSAFTPTGWIRYGRTRRSLRVLQHSLVVEAGFLRHDLFPEIDLVMRAAKLDFDEAWMLLRNEESATRRKPRWIPQYPIRRLIREVRSRHGLQKRMHRGRDLPAPIVLPCTWTARRLVTHKQILQEGIQMGHCVAKYSPRALIGEIQVFSLSAGGGGERATVLVQPPLGAVVEAPFTCVQISGSRNEPVHPSAFVALGELLGHHGPAGLRARVSMI